MAPAGYPTSAPFNVSSATGVQQSIDSIEDGAGGAYVVSLPEPRRQQLEARMRARLLGERHDGAFVLKARAWCARGQVPGT